MSMTVEKNRAAVQETAERLFNRADLSAVDDLIAADAVDHCEPEGTDCRQHFRQVVTMLHTAFPDFRMEITNLVAEGDQVAVHLRMSGTQHGSFMGLAPSGKRFEIDQMRIMRFRDGQMTDSWAVIDYLSWRQQLGAAPPMPARPVTA